MGALRKMSRALKKLRGPGPKVGVLLAMPSLHGRQETSQVLRALIGGMLSTQREFPFYIEPYGAINVSPCEDAMNNCVRYFMTETTHEYLAFWDDDAVPPEDFWKLFGRGDIVTGMTWMWDASRPPLKRLQFNQMRFDANDQSVTVVPTREELDSAEYPIDVTGTHCLVVRRRVFEKLGDRPFVERKGPDGMRDMSCDVWFCRAARAAGFEIKAIPTVIFDHVKPVGLRGVYETVAAAMAVGRRAGYTEGYKDSCEGKPSKIEAETPEAVAATTPEESAA